MSRSSKLIRKSSNCKTTIISKFFNDPISSGTVTSQPVILKKEEALIIEKRPVKRKPSTNNLITEFFEQNEPVDKSLLDFEEPKKLRLTRNRQSVVGKSKPKRTVPNRTQKQPKIINSFENLSKTNQLPPEIIEQSRQLDVNPIEYYKAIELSRSVDSKEKFREIFNRYKFKSGQKSGNGIKQSTSFLFPSAIRRSTPLTRRNTDKQREKIERSIDRIIPNRFYRFITPLPPVEPLNNPYVLLCTDLREFLVSDSSLFHLNGLSDTTIDNYYNLEAGLFEPTTVPVGVLLKDWNSVPGRDPSPVKIHSQDTHVEICENNEKMDVEIENVINLDSDESNDDDFHPKPTEGVVEPVPDVDESVVISSDDEILPVDKLLIKSSIESTVDIDSTIVLDPIDLQLKLERINDGLSAGGSQSERIVEESRPTSPDIFAELSSVNQTLETKSLSFSDRVSLMSQEFEETINQPTRSPVDFKEEVAGPSKPYESPSIICLSDSTDDSIDLLVNPPINLPVSSPAHYQEEFPIDCPQFITPIKLSETPVHYQEDFPDDCLHLITPEKSFHPLPNIDLSTDEYRVKIDNVTPPPDYNRLSSPELQGELSQFGMKELSRRNAIKCLENIYRKTHPIIELDDDNGFEGFLTQEPIKRKRLDADFNKDIRRHKSDSFLLQPHEPLAPIPEFNYENSLNLKLNPECSLVSIDWLKDDEPMIIEPMPPRKVKNKSVHSCSIPFHIAWHNLIIANPQLYDRILQYQQIDSRDILGFFRSIDLRYKLEDVKRFFDHYCISHRRT